MNTVTLADIIDHLVDVIESLTPEAAPTSRTFTLSTTPNRPLRQWVPDAGSNDRIRHFDLRGEGSRDNLGLLFPTANEVRKALRLTVCYPAVPKLYDLTDLKELEALVENDKDQLYDVINGVGGLAGGGHNANFIASDDVDQSDERVWFLEILIDAVFFIARRSN